MAEHPTRTPDRALAGLRVIDFTIMLAGPYCARLLADLGADVIKIESPEGDDMRLRQPLRPDGQGTRHSSYFGQLNAGKRSLALDLKQPEAIDLVRRLVLQADVLLENFRPGVMDRLGLGAEALRALNPRLVYASISGYGQSGPASGQPAYAMIVQAASGYESTLARYAGDRTRPAATATFVADVMGGIYACSAIQTALVQRARTGQGQQVDVALMDCMLNLLIYELQEAQFAVPGVRATYGPVATADGDVMVVPISARNFEALRDVTGLPALREDPRFATQSLRNAHWAELLQATEAWTRTRPRAEVLATLEAAGVPCAPYNEPRDALADPHLAQRGLFSPLRDAAGGFTGVNPPWQLSASPSGAEDRQQVPTVGQHTHEVLRELLQLDAAALQGLRDRGVFGPASR